VPSGSYANIVQKLRPGAAEPGDIVHVDGRVLGRHEGLIHYTVGQRRLAVAVGEPLYVVKLEPETQRLIVGPRLATLCAEVQIKDVNWLTAPTDSLHVQVKHRARETAVTAVDATVQPLPDNKARIKFEKPQSGVAPGQAAVLYQGTRVLGGGWIERAPVMGNPGSTA